MSVESKTSFYKLICVLLAEKGGGVNLFGRGKRNILKLYSHNEKINILKITP